MFTENASIDDVGEIVNGKKTIGHSFAHKKYEYQMEPTAVEETAGKITMKTKVTGTFDGSPTDFQVQMKLESGLIQNLKIDIL